MNNFEELNIFFSEIKSIGFWKRLFGWKKFRELSYEAYQQYKLLDIKLIQITEKLEETEQKIILLENDKHHFSEMMAAGDKSIVEYKTRLDTLAKELTLISSENNHYRETEDIRKTDYERNMHTLNEIRMNIQNERNDEREKNNRMEIERLKSMKENWQRHEEDVKNFIKMICNKYSIEYADTSHFKGRPDNIIKLCGEYIIFDAKSPGGDDLSNFNNYIKSQTEAVRKYIKEDGIKNEIFLVIPSNAAEVINKFSYNVADYIVHIVTKDMLEPLILCLRKIEDYEFVGELSPEDRENICRIIGKFTYINKRRLQVDQILMRESLEILTKRDQFLPHDMIDAINEFEKSEKINLPTDRRTKFISTDELNENFNSIDTEMNMNNKLFTKNNEE